jgi:4-methyl-5(b-hydroxyethyl)-thiazole monophosphate biosynthesis
MPKAMIVLADGFEEIEAFTVIDIMRRANIEIDMIGLVSTIIEGAHKIKTMAQKRLSEINTKDYDMIILPGGQAYKQLLNSEKLLSILRDADQNKKYIAAICAAPTVLAKAGILEDKLATVYPGLEKEIPRPREAKVIVDENIITSNGPGTAIIFAIKLAELLTNKKSAEQLKRDLIVEW